MVDKNLVKLVQIILYDCVNLLHGSMSSDDMEEKFTRAKLCLVRHENGKLHYDLNEVQSMCITGTLFTLQTTCYVNPMSKTWNSLSRKKKLF